MHMQAKHDAMVSYAHVHFFRFKLRCRRLGLGVDGDVEAAVTFSVQGCRSKLARGSLPLPGVGDVGAGDREGGLIGSIGGQDDFHVLVPGIEHAPIPDGSGLSGRGLQLLPMQPSGFASVIVGSGLTDLRRDGDIGHQLELAHSASLGQTVAARALSVTSNTSDTASNPHRIRMINSFN